MKFKKITSIMAIALTIVATSSTLGQGVYAAEKPNTNIQQQAQSMQDSIKLIESKYLIHNNDGTSSISPKAKNVIPADNLKQITNGMNAINAEIKANNLKVKKNINGESKIVSNFKVDNNPFSESKLRASHMSNFTYFWWGFIANVDATGAQQLVADFDAAAYESGAIAIISGAASYGVGTVVCTCNALAAYELKRETLNSIAETPSGVSIYAYGSPKHGQIYKVEQLYN